MVIKAFYHNGVFSRAARYNKTKSGPNRCGERRKVFACPFVRLFPAPDFMVHRHQVNSDEARAVPRIEAFTIARTIITLRDDRLRRRAPGKSRSASVNFRLYLASVLPPTSNLPSIARENDMGGLEDCQDLRACRGPGLVGSLAGANRGDGLAAADIDGDLAIGAVIGTVHHGSRDFIARRDA